MNQANLTGRKKYVLFLLLCGTMQTIAYCQIEEMYKKFVSKDGDINYLAPFQFLEQDTSNTHFNQQHLYQQYSYVHLFDTLQSFAAKQKDKDSLSYLDATQEIVMQIADKRIVMFNEEHHNPFHRLYLETLLTDFKKQGFSVLAVETLNWEDKELNSRKYAISATGTYTKEPYFANLVRKAIKLGYTVLPYETRDTLDYSIANREKNQANNLAKILKEKPGKVLVLAGYMHIAEKPLQGYHGVNEWMASILKREHGIDPLTIDQTSITSIAGIDKVSVPYKDKKIYVPEQNTGVYDISLVYPKNTEYLHKKLGKKKIEVNFSANSVHNNGLIQFYVKKEYETHKDKAIPYEQFLINDTKMSMYLDPDLEYLVVIRDKDYSIITQKRISNFDPIQI